MPQICHYNKTLDNKIATAVSRALNASLTNCVKLKNGEVNHVYEIDTDKGKVIARVFKYDNWPEDGKLQWIEKNLAKHKIPHARMIYFTRSKKFFPHGFMISKFVPGIDGSEAIEQGRLSLSRSYLEKGKILKKIHKIKIKKFGAINAGKGVSDNFLEYKLKRANRFLKRLIKDNVLPADSPAKLNKKVRTLIEPFNKSFRPVLVHGDATRKNTIWSEDNCIVLIDWDNAWSGIAIWDYIELSWWWRHLKIWQDPVKVKTARTSFFKGYGKSEYTTKQIAVLEHGLHLIKSVERLHFFKYDKKNPRFFKLIKKLFLADLYK